MERADWLFVGYTVAWIAFGLVHWRARRRARRLDVRELRDANPGLARAVGAAGVVLVIADVVVMALLVSIAVGLRGAWSVRLVHAAFACLGVSQLYATLVGWRFGVLVVSVPKAQVIEVPRHGKGLYVQIVFCLGLAVVPLVLLALGL
jgi:hypothetical protein